MTESKIIRLMQERKEQKAFQKLYRYYPQVEKYIRINSGSKDEALDIFQDALIILYRKITEATAEIKFSLDGFLINTCKLLWSNELRKKKVRTGDETGLEKLLHEDEIQQQIEKENKFKTIEEVLRQVGEKCKTMLEAFYHKQLSMDSIARKFGYKTVESAKVQKYKCLESARKLALENPLFNESK
jgi:RNA polymerase sigma factor (sigma-70 family)